MSLTGNWSYPTTIKFGAGRLQELSTASRDLGLTNPLFVTDKGLAAQEIVNTALQVLQSDGYAGDLFSEVDPNPNELNLAQGLKQYRDGGHDGVIAFGGGSALDLAKMIAFMSGQSRPVWDFEDIGDW